MRNKSFKLIELIDKKVSGLILLFLIASASASPWPFSLFGGADEKEESGLKHDVILEKDGSQVNVNEEDSSKNYEKESGDRNVKEGTKESLKKTEEKVKFAEKDSVKNDEDKTKVSEKLQNEEEKKIVEKKDENENKDSAKPGEKIKESQKEVNKNNEDLDQKYAVKNGYPYYPKHYVHPYAHYPYAYYPHAQYVPFTAPYYGIRNRRGFYYP